MYQYFYNPDIGIGDGTKDTIKATQGRVQYMHQTRAFKPWFVFDEDGRQRRCKGQRHQRREAHRDRHGQRKLLVDLAGKTTEEGYRHEYRRHDQRGSDNRATDLLHRPDGGVAHTDIVVFTEHALDVFHHQNGVIDHDADRQHQRKQGQQVDREAEQVETGKGRHHRHWHHRHGDDGKAPVLQEHEQDHTDDEEGLNEGGDHRIHRGADEQRGIVGHHVLQPRRETTSQFIHFRLHRQRRFQCIGTRLLVDDDRRHAGSIQLGINTIEGCTQLDTRHIFQQQRRAVRVGTQEDIAEIVGTGQTPTCRHRIGVGTRTVIGRGRQAARRHFGVLRTDRRSHFGRGQVVLRQLVRVHPDAHGELAAA